MWSFSCPLGRRGGRKVEESIWSSMVSVYQSRDYPSMGDRAALPFPSKLLAINQPLVQWKRGNGMNSGLHRRSLAETSYSFSKQPAAHSLDST